MRSKKHFMAKVILTEEEVISLKQLHKQVSERRLADRIKLVLLLHQGYSQRQISGILLLDEDTITLWVKRFTQRSSIDTWYQDHYVSRCVGHLSFRAISEVLCHINTFFVRKITAIQAFIEARFGVKYHPSSIYYLLKRTRQSYKQLVKLPGQINHAAQEKFVVEYKALVEKLPDNQTVMFIDAAHPQHNSTSSKVWTEAGKPRYIPSNTGREHLNINGAYNPLNQDVIVREDTTIDANSTIALLQSISDYYPTKDTVYVFADNARSNKCKAITQWLESQTKIQLRYLPPYSPNLNFIERLWKIMRSYTIHTHFYASFSDFKEAIWPFFRHIASLTHTLEQTIGTKMQLYTIP